MEDGRGVEVAVHRLDRTGAGATGRPGRGGAQGGASYRGGGTMEEPATPAAVGPGLDDGAAVVIDLSEWAWTRGWAGRA
jgi:hypothetical protein